MTKPRSPNGINFALFGLGKFGKNYQRLLNPKAIVTAHSENADEVLKNPKIDAVVIATPPSTHFKLAKKALQAGKHVLLEKPMVLSVADAKKLRKIVKKSGKVFMVGFQYLYNDYINWLKKEIENGSFGKIIEVKSEHRLSPPNKDIDIFWNAAPHPLSIFQYFFSPEKLISAEGKIEYDSAEVKVKFENAPILEIITSCLGKQKTRKLTIVGEKATAVLDETLEKDKLAIIKRPRAYARGTWALCSKKCRPPPTGFYNHPSLMKDCVVKKGQVTNPKIDFKEPLRAEVEHFIYCIQTDSKPLTNIDFGYQITEWLDVISKNTLD